jgi:hypothetical protein
MINIMDEPNAKGTFVEDTRDPEDPDYVKYGVLKPADPPEDWNGINPINFWKEIELVDKVKRFDFEYTKTGIANLFKEAETMQKNGDKIVTKANNPEDPFTMKLQPALVEGVQRVQQLKSDCDKAEQEWLDFFKYFGYPKKDWAGKKTDEFFGELAGFWKEFKDIAEKKRKDREIEAEKAYKKKLAAEKAAAKAAAKAAGKAGAKGKAGGKVGGAKGGKAKGGKDAMSAMVDNLKGQKEAAAKAPGKAPSKGPAKAPAKAGFKPKEPPAAPADASTAPAEQPAGSDPPNAAETVSKADGAAPAPPGPPAAKADGAAAPPAPAKPPAPPGPPKPT